MKPLKKIRLDGRSNDLNDESDYQKRMLTFMEQIDWKLWEILKLLQREYEDDSNKPDNTQ